MQEEKRNIKCYTLGSNAVKFNDEMDFDSMSCIMDCISAQIEKETFNGELTIYFSSVGGIIPDMLDFAHYINNLCENIEINFVLNGDISSAGVFLLYEIIERCNFEFSESVAVMLHTVNRDTKTRDKHQNESYQKSLDYINNGHYEVLKKSGLPKNLLKKFKNGEDIYLTGYEFEDYFYNYRALLEQNINGMRINILENELNNLKNT